MVAHPVKKFSFDIGLEIVRSFEHVSGIQFPFLFQSIYQRSRQDTASMNKWIDL